MKLHSRKPEISNRPILLNSLNWSSPAAWQESTWVQLRQSPSPYSHDEALLLCQHSETEWVAWVPQYGEIILDESQFCEIGWKVGRLEG